MKTLSTLTSSTILDTIPILVFIKDKTNKLVIVNQTFATIFGKKKAELQGKSVYDLFPKELADKYWEDDKQILKTELPTTRIIELFQSASGEQRWYRTDKFPYYNDKKELIGILGYAVDIHDAKIENDRLLTLQTAVKYSPSIVVITDVEGKITFVNPQFEKVTGYTAKEAIGQKASFLRSGKVADRVYTDMWETITNNNIWHGEFINKTKNGSLYWEIASISPVFNNNNELINYIKVASSLSDLKRTAFNVWNLFEESDNYIVLLDKDMRIVYCNKTLAKLLGYESINDIIGDSWLKYVTEETHDTVQLIHSEILKKSKAAGEFINEIKDASGNLVLVKWFNTLINGDSHLTFSVGLPIEAINTGKESIEEIRRHFKSTIDSDKQFIIAMKQKINRDKKK